MAPRGRGRPRKVGLRRMDAAIDAMEPFGFSKELVLKTIKNLLKVYDGDEGWVFIEEASYKLLIETILEEQEKGCFKDDSLHEEARGGDDSQPSAAGPSSAVPDDSSSFVAGISSGVTDDVEPSAARPSGGVLGDAKLPAAGPEPYVVDTALQTNQTEAKDCLPPTEGVGKGWRDIVLNKKSGPKQTDNGIGNNGRSSGATVHHRNIVLPGPVDSLPKRRRKRCYGWICSDDEDDILDLMAAVFPRQVENTISGTERRRKRKSRWDVRPEDM